MNSLDQDAEMIYKNFDKAESVFNNDNELFQTKAEYLVQAWRELGNCCVKTHINHLKNILNWAKRHTLNIILSGDWKEHKGNFEKKLTTELENCEKELLKLDSSFSLHCKKIAKVISDPWGHPTLSCLLTDPKIEIGNEVFDFFMSESGFLISFRLKKLCESHCEDLALNLVTSYMACCNWAKEKNYNMNVTEDQRRFMLDVYISLLYKFKKTSVIVTTLKALSLSEGVQLVKRFAKKRVNISKLWRHSIRITHLAAVLFCSSAIIKPLEESSDVITSLLAVWLPLGEKEGLEQLVRSIRKIVQVALSASHLYIFCETLSNLFGTKMKTFVIELYIQALTTDLNDLERQKIDSNKVKELETSERLSNGFLKLAEVLEEYSDVSRECVLTSFSLNPTKDCLARIENIARLCGYEVLDTGQWKCKLHPPVSSLDELCTQCEECGEFMGQLNLEAALNTNMALNEALSAEQLGVSRQLCDDLAVILSSPRYQFLSWLQKWRDLHRLCVMYLNNPERTKNIVTELKFVEIDYSLFMHIKREPIEEEVSHCYDEVLTKEFNLDCYLPEEKKMKKKPGRKKKKDYTDVFVPPPKANTDPGVLKTLRSFRRNLKRKDSDNECNSPEKVFVPNNSSPSAVYSNSPVPYVPNVYYDYAGRFNSSSYPDMYSNALSDFMHYNNEIVSNSKPFRTNSLFETNIADNYKIRLHPPTELKSATEIAHVPTTSREEPKILHASQSPSSCQQPKVNYTSESNASAVDADLLYCSGLFSGPSNARLDVSETSDIPVNTPLNPPVCNGSSSETQSKSEDTLIISKNIIPNNDIFSKAVVERSEKLLCTEDKVPPWKTSSSLQIKTPKTECNSLQQTKGGCFLRENKTQLLDSNFHKGGGSFLEDDKGGHEKTKDIQLDSPSSVTNSDIEKSSLFRDVNKEALIKNTEDETKSKVPEQPKSAKIDCSSSYEELKVKYDLKELKVILQRINVKSNKVKEKITKAELRAIFANASKKRRGRKAKKRNAKKSENKSNMLLPKDDYKSSLMQDVKPRVLLDRNEVDKNYFPKKFVKDPKDPKNMVPRVILKRLDIDKLNVKSILANVPGLHDTEMMRPSAVESVVQVVQLAGGRSTTTVQSQNNQTSTQVSPHIQRIGQPRIDKPESNPSDSATTTDNTKTSTTATNAKPPSSQPSTLINILSQQIIRPGQSSTRTSPFINILSQPVIRPGNTTTVKPTSATQTTTDSQPQTGTTRIVTSGDQQIINQLVSPVRSGGTLKTVVGTSTSDQSRIVQFICKSSDGKLIPVTSFTPNRVVKVATTQTVTSSSPASPNFDDNFAKLVQASPKPKNDVQVESPDSLPKFQQAFGKTVYQNNVDSNTPNANIVNNVVNNVELDKTKLQVKGSTSLNVQPIQGGVIYTRQVPVGQTINLIPPGRGQVFRIATSNSEQISLVKDTVIQNKMSALLAAALQGKQKHSETAEIESSGGDTNSIQTNARVAITTRPTLVQNARIVKPVLQVPSNVIRNTQANLSSTTLEQLREFDMVYKQVKERSSTSNTSEASVIPESSDNSQRISVTYLNQGQKLNCSPVVVVSSYSNLQPAASPALSVASQGSSSPCVTPAPTPTPVLPKVAAKSSKGKSVKNATMHTAKASPIPKPQQKPQEDEHTTQRIFDILAEYAEQLRNSPDLNNKPAPRRRSNPPTNPSQNSKRKKSAGSKKTGQCSNSATSDIDTEDPRTLGSEDSSCGVVQISMQEDEQSSVTVNASESNDSTNVQPRQQLILTDSSSNQTRNLIIADSSVGEALKMPNTAVLVPGNYIMPVSMVKGGQQIAVVSGGSKILATVPARSGPNMLLFQSFLNQNRKTNVSTVKYSTIQPLSGISSQSLAGVSGQQPVILPSSSHAIGTVALGQPLTIKKMEDNDRINTELLLTISQPQENNMNEDTQQPDSSTNIATNIETVDLEENTTLSDNSSDKPYTYQKTLIATPIATPVIAQTCNKDDISNDQTASSQTIMSINLDSLEQNKGESGKVEERVQSVLVSAGTSNGPMLSHSPPHYNKQTDCSESVNDQFKDDFLRNGGKRMNSEQKNLQTNTVYTLQGKLKKQQPQKLDRDIQQLSLQRKALERELRLQKSLSEECEDLGVAEPSTSDLFPEADLMIFDANHSPSFDQSSQDLIKRPVHCEEKEETKLTLFSDDDFLLEAADYPTDETVLEYDDRSHLLTNGQSGAIGESVTHCEDNTLLQTCTSMSDVTLNSPISPDRYNATTSPPLHKYVHKYTNRKKHDRVKQIENWPVEVSSSEDTTGSTELIKGSSCSPEMCSKKSEDEIEDGNFKVVHVAISKTECDNIHCLEGNECSFSGRGARRSVKKMCSCCNGSQEAAASRKRPAPQPQTPAPQKKIFNKKR